MKKVFLLIGIFLFVHTGMNAQLGGIKRKLERKLEERLAKKAADKIEEKIDEKIAEEEAKNGKKKNKKNKDRPSVFDMGNMSGEKPEEVKDSYEFDFQIDWRITSNSKDMEEPVDMSQFYSNTEKYMGMKAMVKEKKEEKEFINVMDFENEFFVMLMPEEQQGVLMAIPNLEEQMDEEMLDDLDEDPKDFNLEKTSETKDILGYSCTKYLFTNENSKGEYWLTTDLDYKNFDMFSYFKNMADRRGLNKTASYQTAMEGFMLEMKAEDTDETITHMIVTNIDKDADQSIETTDYQFMDMRGMKGFGRFNNNKK